MSRVKRKRVLFVCIGNCCRSQMAEGFAHEYGGDIVTPESAGLAPAGMIVDETVRAMAQKSVDISNQYSKAFRLDEANECDFVVNMSGLRLPEGYRRQCSSGTFTIRSANRTRCTPKFATRSKPWLRT